MDDEESLDWSWSRSWLNRTLTKMSLRTILFCDDVEAFFDRHFELSLRSSSFSTEVYAGGVQWLCCLYIMPVVARQLEAAGYSRAHSSNCVAFVSGTGCILASYTTNLPLVLAPPAAVSIFLSVSMQRQALTLAQGNTAVVLSGVLLVGVGLFRSFSRLLTRCIPECIQFSTAVGIGLITALAGLIEIGAVVRGSYTITTMGQFTPSLLIGLFALIVIGVAQHHQLKGSLVLGLVVGSVLVWTLPFDQGGDSDWPKSLFAPLSFDTSSMPSVGLLLDSRMCHLVLNLVFLYVLVLNGLARSLSDLAGLTNPTTGAIPRGNWLFIFCGIATIFSGFLGGPPVLISPESAAGIKAGARTGLSTLVCGLCFVVSAFFSPFFCQIPASATSPLLLLVGMLLFQNVGRIDWQRPRDSISAFLCLLLIPFTYSIISGTMAGYVVFILYVRSLSLSLSFSALVVVLSLLCSQQGS